MRSQLFILLILIIPLQSKAQVFAGTDDLGRVLPMNDSVGNPREDKQVALFYFLWQGDKNSKISERYWDLNKIVPKHSEVLDDFDNQYWGSPEVGKFYFWGKPIYGYYRGDDYWVHLRSIQLLTDAGVDVLVIDTTNRFIYSEQANALMEAMQTVRAQGKNPPKIAFYTNTASGRTMQKIYDTFYKDGAPYRHPPSWYYLDGKPLIIGITAEAAGKDYEHFFTYRESQWPNEEQKLNGWPWIEFVRPQKVYYNHKGQKEIVNVAIAQHPNWEIGMSGSAFYGNRDNWGRSYHDGAHGNPTNNIAFGYNFQEQWDFALKQDVPFIFVTGWNEWVAGRWKTKDGGNLEHSRFVDLASPEFSRDAEPSLTGGMQDNYYLQMVANIRRYKGIDLNFSAGTEKTIRRFSDWNDNIIPVYTDYIHDTHPRNHPGAQSKPAKTYLNNTGRNDFHLLKVSRDQSNIYFYAETKDGITENTGSNWMRLYLNIDRKPTGWLGYDFRVVEGNKLQKYFNNEWADYKTIDFTVQDKRFMVTIPLKHLNLKNDVLNFEFKWSDNMQNDNDPLDWYVNGDVAPGGRFNFIYNTK